MDTTKLLPPIVENKILAQNSTILKIPFQMNRAVGMSEIDTIIMLVKSVQSGTTLGTLSCNINDIYYQDNCYWAIFTNNSIINLQVGQYYKFQLAYSFNNNIGFYSTMSTFKFTSEPILSIRDLNSNSFNNHLNSYVGEFTNEDTSEKVWLYEFNLYDDKDNLIYTSGEQLHNILQNIDSKMSIDIWDNDCVLQGGTVYKLIYKIKTINGIECTSPIYSIQLNQAGSSILFYYYDFIAQYNVESACVDLFLQSKYKNFNRTLGGKFTVLRASDKDNFTSWIELTKFTLIDQSVKQDRFICKDYYTEQGVNYKYAIQTKTDDNSFYSKKEESAIVKMEFEDMFLSDGERQLKIQFNPKISSIKNTLLESKIDTLGGQYPFFFRNGNVKYKEFPISGLISMLMDTNEEFLSGIQYPSSQRSRTPAFENDYLELSTSLTRENVKKERIFKMEVLEWLTNGKPKVFRSPTEGNFIVRLMNSSLSPNDTLGRMLHTFNCTAYEIDEFSLENLRKYNMTIKEKNDDVYSNTISIDLQDMEVAPGSIASNLNAYAATLTTEPNTAFYYCLQNDSTKYNAVTDDSGNYTFSALQLNGKLISEIGNDQGIIGWGNQAILTYSYYSQYNYNNFNYTKSIDFINKTRTWCGNSEDIISSYLDQYQILHTIYLIDNLEIYYRPIEKVDSAELAFGSSTLYQFKIKDQVYRPELNSVVLCNGIYYDGRTSTKIGTTLDYNIKLNKNGDMINMQTIKPNDLPFNCDVNIWTKQIINLKNIPNVDSLYFGSGLYGEISFQQIDIEYSVETEDESVQEAKDQWIANPTSQQKYEQYYNALINALSSKSEELIVSDI